MSKRKRGKHAEHVAPGVRKSLTLLESWPTVARVLVGHTAARNRRAYPDGYIKVQRTDAHTLQAVGFAGQFLYELTILAHQPAHLPAIAAQIATTWPPR